jgi:hypothetical protein
MSKRTLPLNPFEDLTTCTNYEQSRRLWEETSLRLINGGD